MFGSEKYWYVLSVKPNQEYSVIKNLEALGVQTYLPLYKKKKKVNKKKTDVIVPLFQGYIFCKFIFEKHYQKIRYTRGVKKILGNKRSLWIINEEKIEDIRKREKGGVVILKKKQEHFNPGTHIIVDEGDFDGWEGIFFEDLPDEERAVILLTSVNYTNKMILPKKYLKSV